MNIIIPPDVEMLAMSQATTAGFTSVDDYVANLIRRQSAREPNGSREQAFRELRELRKELPELNTAEIVRSVHEARTPISADQWRQFVHEMAGSIPHPTFERHPQRVFEHRDHFSS